MDRLIYNVLNTYQLSSTITKSVEVSVSSSEESRGTGLDGVDKMDASSPSNIIFC